MRRIQSKKKKLETHQIDKVSLSVFTDKRFFSDDGIHRLVYFQSTYFFRCNLSGRNIHVVFTYLFQRNFDGQNLKLVVN